jgi:nitroreductase/NAD-dependent dihydropyrimidine dehydrogenase PreA subunit
MNIFPVKIEQRCTDCGKCEEVCSRHISRPRPEDALPDCISCFQCYAVCPNNAVTFSIGKTVETGPEPVIDKDNLKSFLAFRRSCRIFSDRTVERETILELVHSAQLIPSGGNAHNCKFTVIADAEVKTKLFNLIKKRYAILVKLLKMPVTRFLLKLFSDPVTSAFLKDKDYFGRIVPLMEGLREGKDPLFYNAPVIIAVHSDRLIPTPGPDCILAAYNIVLMSQAMGFGTCFVSLAQNAINNSGRCRKFLNLGKKEKIYALLLLGYSKVKYQRQVPGLQKDHYSFIASEMNVRGGA